MEGLSLIQPLKKSPGFKLERALPIHLFEAHQFGDPLNLFEHIGFFLDATHMILLWCRRSEPVNARLCPGPHEPSGEAHLEPRL